MKPHIIYDWDHRMGFSIRGIGLYTQTLGFDQLYDSWHPCERVSFDGIYPIKSIQLLVLHLMKYPHHIPAKRLLEDMIFLVFKTKKAAFFDGKVILL